MGLKRWQKELHEKQMATRAVKDENRNKTIYVLGSPSAIERMVNRAIDDRVSGKKHIMLGAR